MSHHSNTGRTLRSAVLIAALLGGWWLAEAQEAPALPDRLQMDAYLALFRGDEARDEGRMEEAAQAYREAADAYRALQSRHPAHQPSMVSYRLSHAERELNAIEQERPAAPPAEVDEEQFERERINALRTENRYLRQKLLTLEEELQRGVEPSPDFVQELDRLSQKNQELGVTLSTLRKQLEVSNVDRTELRAAQQEARELKTVVASQRSQLADQRSRSEELGALREQVSGLKNRNRQLELAIKGAEQEANTIGRLEEELRVQHSKGKMLLAERTRLADDVKAMKAREETLQGHRQRLEASQAETEKALAASFTEAQTVMERSTQLEEAVARAEVAAEELRSELAAAEEGQEDARVELAEVEAELRALRKTHIEAEATTAQLRKEALEARDLETRMAEMDQSHRDEIASIRQAQAETIAARAQEVEQERAASEQAHAEDLEAAVRRGEDEVAAENARHAAAVSNLLTKHAADLEDLKSAMQVLKDDLKLALNAPGPAAENSLNAPVPMRLTGDQQDAVEARWKMTMLQDEYNALLQEKARLVKDLETRDAEMIEMEKELIGLRARLERVKF